jgi:hypothetical protein
MVRKHAYGPSKDTRVFVCGMASVYDSMCGPRGDKGVSKGTILDNLGYTDEMVEKF